MEKIKKLDVQYIIFNGYYTNKDDGEELQEHTEETLALWHKGFEMYDFGDKDFTENEDVFNGICFDVDGMPLAEWWIDGTEEYFEIK
jgi:hypothetical protein